MVSIARKNLFEDLPRFLVAQAGIMFAVALVTIQTGILNGFARSTVLLIQRSKADIWLVSEDLTNLELTSPLLSQQTILAREVPGVERAEPVITGLGRWNIPGEGLTSVRVFGFNPDSDLFGPGRLEEGKIEALKQPYQIIVDRANLDTLHLEKIGDTAKIGALPVSLAGITYQTQSIVSPAFVFASLETAKAYITGGLSSRLDCKMINGVVQCTNRFEPSKNLLDTAPSTLEPLSGADPVQYILIKAKPGQDLPTLQRKLEIAVPGSRAYTRQEIAKKTQTYWQKRTGVGFILGLGAAVGVLVGVVVVSQILYASVSDRMKEYGTLKAMGASNQMLYGVIIEQSLYMAVLGYIPGLLFGLGLGIWTSTTQGILIVITPLAAIGVFGLTVMMCIGSALFAIQKVTRVDPIIVFKA